MRGYKNFESDPHPGDLRHLVEIGHTVNAINENGYPEPTDVVVCKVWAAVIDAGNQHYRAADVMNTEAVINFTNTSDRPVRLSLVTDSGKELFRQVISAGKYLNEVPVTDEITEPCWLKTDYLDGNGNTLYSLITPVTIK